MNNRSVIGLDLAKIVFHLVTLSWVGHQDGRKKLRRSQVLAYMAQLPPSRIAMEACASAHYWAREFQKLGHQVVLLPPKHVKGYLRGQKNDYNDALAIAEACLHGAIRPVAVKSVEQQEEQAFHRIRKQLTGERTRLANQLRGLLAEYGIVFPKGEAVIRRELPGVIKDLENVLPPRFRQWLERQYQRFTRLDEELDWYDQQLKIQSREDDICHRLTEVPGFGPVVSSAYKSWIGDGKQFRRGRDASAALGVVPRQYSTGGKEVLLGITKRGDRYVRSLVIHGARSVAIRAAKKTDPLSLWINHVVATRGFNKAVVALANKMIRIGWAVVARNEHYRPLVA